MKVWVALMLGASSLKCNPYSKTRNKLTSAPPKMILHVHQNRSSIKKSTNRGDAEQFEAEVMASPVD